MIRPQRKNFSKIKLLPKHLRYFALLENLAFIKISIQHSWLLGKPVGGA
jgi:hypothetical protein